MKFHKFSRKREKGKPRTVSLDAKSGRKPVYGDDELNVVSNCMVKG